MKNKLILICVASILCLGAGLSTVHAQKKGKKKKKCKGKCEQTVTLSTSRDSLSYALGVALGDNIKNQGLDSLNLQALFRGLEDVTRDTSTIISIPVSQSLINAEMKKLQEKQLAEQQAKAKKMKQEGIDFLAKNKEKPGVTVTESGLQYEVLKEGNGPKPTLQDMVTTHYHGTLIDGTVFDSSVERGSPASFPLGNVIKGWQEALQLMSVGSKYRIFLPSELAYGERGAGAKIPGGSALIFEVELISIEGK